MVVSNYPNWVRLLRQIGRLLAVVFALSIVSVLVDRYKHLLQPITVPDIAISVLGAALGILLAFRTNSAYSRWWEARILWGAMVNQSRSLARQAVTFASHTAAAGEPLQDFHIPSFSISLVRKQIAFVHATRCALRREEPGDQIAPFLTEDDLRIIRTFQNVPAALLQIMGEEVTAAVDRKLLTEWHMTRLDATLSELANVLGGCERIKNTPLPRQYDYYPELLIKMYCVLLPFVIVDQVGLLTPVITTLVAFAFLVLNRIGKNLEDPFENQPYDVPLTALCRTIEINLLQSIGDRNAPAPLKPVQGVLM